MIARALPSGVKEMPTLREALGLPDPGLSKKPYVISFVGAGGKTTSILALAKELSEAGGKVLIVTTTHMQTNEPYYTECGDISEEASESKCFAAPDLDALCEQILKKAAETGIVSCGVRRGPGSMTWMGDALYERVRDSFDYILNEADGAKRHPFKTPASYEPVILPGTQQIAVMVGLSAIGRSLEDVCFRYQLLDDAPDTILSPKLAARIIKKGYGVLPYPLSYILNQADTDEDIIRAKEIAKYLKPVILTSYQID